jgi:hypothetical protein
MLGKFRGPNSEELKNRTLKLTSKQLQNYMYSERGYYVNKPDPELVSNARAAAQKYAKRGWRTKIGRLKKRGNRWLLIFEGKPIDELLPASLSALPKEAEKLGEFPIKFRILLIVSRDRQRQWANISLSTDQT